MIYWCNYEWRLGHFLNCFIGKFLVMIFHFKWFLKMFKLTNLSILTN
jgi:hypothetical protein